MCRANHLVVDSNACIIICISFMCALIRACFHVPMCVYHPFHNSQMDVDDKRIESTFSKQLETGRLLSAQAA